MAKRSSEVACPQCRDHRSVVPIVYGQLTPSQHDLVMAGLIVMGGQPLYDDGRDPTHFCTACEHSFRPQASACDTEA